MIRGFGNYYNFTSPAATERSERKMYEKNKQDITRYVGCALIPFAIPLFLIMWGVIGIIDKAEQKAEYNRTCREIRKAREKQK